MDAQAIIAGGGMVGLSLAAALGGAGVAVTVVDRMSMARATAPAFDGRSSAIAGGSKPILEGIGAWPGMEKEAAPILVASEASLDDLNARRDR